MSDAPSSGEPKRSLLERLSALLLRAPEDREQLLSLLRTSHERELLDDDALSMIEGVLQVAELSTRDIMVPRSQIKLIDISQASREFLPHVIATAHSWVWCPEIAFCSSQPSKRTFPALANRRDATLWAREWVCRTAPTAGKRR